MKITQTWKRMLDVVPFEEKADIKYICVAVLPHVYKEHFDWCKHLDPQFNKPKSQCLYNACIMPL